MSRLQVKVDRLADLVKSINSLTSKSVLVGIPQAETERDEDTPITNAALGYINEFGSPAQNIPARPFLIPGIEDAQDKIEGRLKKAAEAAVSGAMESKIDDQLSAAGLIAQNSVKGKIDSGDFEPLAEATLRARARKGRKGAKAELESRASGNAPDNANARPLIDTGQMRNAITYVLRNK